MNFLTVILLVISLIEVSDQDLNTENYIFYESIYIGLLGPKNRFQSTQNHPIPLRMSQLSRSESWPSTCELCI